MSYNETGRQCGATYIFIISLCSGECGAALVQLQVRGPPVQDELGACGQPGAGSHAGRRGSDWEEELRRCESHPPHLCHQAE